MSLPSNTTKQFHDILQPFLTALLNTYGETPDLLVVPASMLTRVLLETNDSADSEGGRYAPRDYVYMHRDKLIRIIPDRIIYKETV